MLIVLSKRRSIDVLSEGWIQTNPNFFEVSTNINKLAICAC